MLRCEAPGEEISSLSDGLPSYPLYSLLVSLRVKPCYYCVFAPLLVPLPCAGEQPVGPHRPSAGAVGLRLMEGLLRMNRDHQAECSLSARRSADERRLSDERMQ